MTDINKLRRLALDGDFFAILEFIDHLEDAEETKNNWLRANAPEGRFDASIILAHYNAIPTLIEEVKLRGGSFYAWDRARTLTHKYQGWELVMKRDIEAHAAIAKVPGEMK